MSAKPLLIALGLACGTAFADGGINGMLLDPPAAKTGQDVKIIVTADEETAKFCGLGIDFGDGEVRDIKIDSDGAKFPITVAKQYAKPGQYTVKAFGKKITTHFPCGGQAEASVTVAGATPAIAPVARSAAPSPSCPEGYALKGSIGKAGDYTCKAKPKAPENCGAGLEPFASGDSLGCRKSKGKK